MNTPSLPVSQPVLVIGCGLMGTSAGLALRRVGVAVYLRDLRRGHVEVAASVGAGLADEPPEVGIVIVAVPPDHVADVAAGALKEFPEATVTDLSSVKLAPLRGIEASGADAARYVGSHPMAGSERSGPAAASEQLFDGRAWAIVADDRVPPARVQVVRDLAVACGATVIEMGPGEHDAAVARVSHLPHLMSVLAAAQLEGSPGEHLSLAGQGLRDVTRIAASDPGLWRQIVGGNAAELTGLLRSVRDDLDVLIGGLADQPAEVEGVLRRGVRGTELIPGKHGAAAAADATVFVQVPDQAGELARLFTDAGESGVNVEDLHIDHDPARPVGLVEVVVHEDRADVLVDALTERGWLAYR